ncbi:MAG: DUF3465 domain-containing protein [Candidatus Tyrphobacter sp.]
MKPAAALPFVMAVVALSSCTPGPNDAALCRAIASSANGTEVVADGTVTQILGTHPGRSGAHEGFVLHLGSGCDASLRVETNVDFTGPIPLRTGERVVVKGEYDSDPDGSVIHFTHREVRGRHPGGYVIAGGRYYW